MGASRRKRRKKPVVPAAASPPPADAAGPRARLAMRVVVIAYLFLAGLYAVGIPLGKGPDETAHMRYFTYLAEHHTLPVFDRDSPGPDYEFHQPPLYYAVCLPTYLLATRHGGTGDLAVRFATILLGLPLLYLTFALARTLAPTRPWLGPAAAGLVAFLPMHLALAASVSNDVLTEVFFAAFLCLAAQHLRAAADYRTGKTPNPPGVLTMAVLGLLIGLGILTKSIAVLLLPAAWLTAALSARGRDGYDWSRLARDAALSTGVALAVAGWWLVRNYQLYDGFLAQKAFLQAFRDRPSPQSFMSSYGLAPPSYVILVIGWTLASVVGVFGPKFAFLPFQVYLVTGLIALVGLAGFARYLARAELQDWQRQAWVVFGLLGFLLLAGFIKFNLSFFQAQARYLFPALPAAALAFGLGFEQWFPRGWRHGAPLAAALGLALLALLALPLWITPQLQIP